MNATLQSLVTIAAYVLVGGLAVIGAKYNVIDTTTSNFLLGAVLTHLGFVGAPATASAIKASAANSQQAAQETTQPPTGAQG